MKGKDKCLILKQIREEIARKNNITFVTSECTHKGDCLGTCPKCESEVRYLEEQLAKRRTMQKRVAVTGISMGIALTLSGCSAIDMFKNAPELVGAMLVPTPTSIIEELDGDIAYYPEDEMEEFPEETPVPVESQHDGNLIAEGAEYIPGDM